VFELRIKKAKKTLYNLKT